MNQRDISIIKALEQFRVLSRDHIIEMFFREHKQAVTCANNVLRRLVLKKQITVNKTHTPYLYFPSEHIKLDSVKIPHFLRIADFYLDVCKHGKPSVFQVEPKYGKGFPEPDAFMTFRGVNFFCEIQRTAFSTAQIADKVKRYETYYSSGIWREYSGTFPNVLIISETHVPAVSDKIRILQANSFATFLFRAEEAKRKAELAKKAKPIIKNPTVR
jgi:hypothetical protein